MNLGYNIINDLRGVYKQEVDVIQDIGNDLVLEGVWNPNSMGIRWNLRLMDVQGAGCPPVSGCSYCSLLP